MILILIFSWNFKILDFDIEAKKPFLPISAVLVPVDVVGICDDFDEGQEDVFGEDLLHELPGDLAGGVLLGKEEEDGQVRHLPQVLHLPLGTQHLGMHHIPGAIGHTIGCV